MGQLSFAPDRPALVVSRSGNVLPFDGTAVIAYPRSLRGSLWRA